MPIIIPSNKSYSTKNSKIMKNKIGVFDFSYNDARVSSEIVQAANIDFGTSDWEFKEAAPGDFQQLKNYPEYSSDKTKSQVIVREYDKYHNHAAVSAIIPFYKKVEFSVSQQYKDGFIPKESLYFETMKKVRHIQTVINLELKSGNAIDDNSQIEYDALFKPDFFGAYETDVVDEIITISELPSSAKSTSTLYDDYQQLVDTFSSEVTLDSVDDYTVTFDDINKKYDVIANILCGVSIIKAFGEYRYSLLNNFIYEYRPISVTINVYGEKKALVNEKTPITIENSSDKSGVSSSLPNSIFLQNSNKEIAKNRLTGIIEDFKNGKETATLLCSVGDYYDENGNRVVSTETSGKMTFNLYDEVLPCYKTPYGDAPMSMADGKAKTFTVLGSKVYFDGAVWQEISLQESGLSDHIIQDGTQGIDYEYYSDSNSYTAKGFKADATKPTDTLKIASALNGIRVDTVADNAFKSKSLSNVKLVLPDTIEEIGVSAFENSGISGQITLPKSLTKINDRAFLGSKISGLLVIPSYVHTIGEEAFRHSNISNIIFNDKLTEIPNAVFAECPSLQKINIPNTIKTIGNNTFGSCPNVSVITVGEGVESIDTNGFDACTNLRTLYFNAVDCDTNGTGLRSPFTACGTAQQGFDVIFGNKVKKIPDNIFKPYIGATEAQNVYSYVKSAYIPPSVETIGYSAFDGCTSLTSVTIGDGVKSIGVYAFYYCTSLRDVTIPDSVTSIGGSAFSNCRSLTSVTIGDSVTSIGSYAFSNLTNITSLTIPNSVTSIGEQAFINCTNLSSVTIGNGVISISNGAFRGCTRLTSVTMSKNVKSVPQTAFADSIVTTLTAPTNAISVFDKTKIEKLHINGGDTMSSEFFYMKDKNPQLKDLTISGSIKEIAYRAFSYCQKLESVDIKPGVQTIGLVAFAACYALRTINIPESVTEIRDGAFNYASSTSSVSNLTVYYGGSRESWNRIKIGTDNSHLLNATIYFAK